MHKCPTAQRTHSDRDEERQREERDGNEKDWTRWNYPVCAYEEEEEGKRRGGARRAMGLADGRPTGLVVQGTAGQAARWRVAPTRRNSPSHVSGSSARAWRAADPLLAGEAYPSRVSFN